MHPCTRNEGICFDGVRLFTAKRITGYFILGSRIGIFLDMNVLCLTSVKELWNTTCLLSKGLLVSHSFDLLGKCYLRFVSC